MQHDILRNIDTLQYQLQLLVNKRHTLESLINSQSLDIEILQKKLDLIARAKAQYKKAIDDKYTVKIHDLENLLNTVVANIFEDKSYEVRIDLSDKYNKSLSFWLYDKKRDLLTNLSRHGTGKGVKTVVSTIIYLYYLLKFNIKYIFIDEGFVNIDASYVDTFFVFLKQLLKAKNATIVLNTHDERFDPYGDETYYVNDGVVTYVTSDEQ